MQHPDEVANKLAALNVPEPRSNAVHCIIEQAQQTKRRKLRLLDPVRALRAQLYVPSIRTAVMASVFGGFIAIGGINRLSENEVISDQPVQQAGLAQQRIPITADNLPNDVLLYDVEFNESDPLEDMWEV